MAVNHRLYRLPPQTTVVLWSGVPLSQPDSNVYVIVRDCKKYTQQIGQWWWKRMQVDYRACVDDPATEGDVKIIGELKPAENPSSPPARIRYTFACDFCEQGRLVNLVTIALAATRDNGVVPFKLPPNLRLYEG